MPLLACSEEHACQDTAQGYLVCSCRPFLSAASNTCLVSNLRPSGGLPPCKTTQPVSIILFPSKPICHSACKCRSAQSARGRHRQKIETCVQSSDTRIMKVHGEYLWP